MSSFSCDRVRMAVRYNPHAIHVDTTTGLSSFILTLGCFLVLSIAFFSKSRQENITIIFLLSPSFCQLQYFERRIDILCLFRAVTDEDGDCALCKSLYENKGSKSRRTILIPQSCCNCFVTCGIASCKLQTKYYSFDYIPLVFYISTLTFHQKEHNHKD